MSAAARASGGAAARRGRIGLPHVHGRELDSTNERAKGLGAGGAPHGTLVTADRQTAGRGRQGRRWEAPAGRALLASVIVRPLDERDVLLPLAAAVAVCEACEHAAPVTCRIKWPNDVWIDRRKVAGVLIEGRPQERWAVVGVGVNVTTAAAEFPPELRGAATSLAVAAREPGDLSVATLLEALLESLSARLEDPPERILSEWRERDALVGRPVDWGEGGGIAAGVDDQGNLLVDAAAGRVVLGAGEVHLRRSGG
ncbi:MAG: biotin--[acetyl-CoA-carboxylase] ligase [Thermoleophilaceae bacterium]|jgi:BirA family biotin operon repressor/biotin-[acetyl-CoA-carboxylase] ligase